MTNFLLLIFLLGFLTGCSAQSEAPETTDTADGQIETGKHGGRLLREGDLALEVTIFETGVDPQFRIYAYDDSTPVSPEHVDLKIELERLGGNIDKFSFTPREDYLLGDGIVTEPHSFEVRIRARYQGQTFNWRYESFEGRTQIDDAVAETAGLETEAAGPAMIRLTLPATGKIAFAPDAVAEIRAPYIGRVVSIEASVGSKVRRGDVLARLENVSTLQPFNITAPFNGVVIERDTNVGDVTGQTSLFVIGDSSRLEAQLHIFPKDQARVSTGQTVNILLPGSKEPVTTEIFAFMPVVDADSQSLIARAALSENNAPYPGLRIDAEVVTDRVEASLAVKTSGLQKFRDFMVVFAKVGETYEVRMLDLGAMDGEWAQVHGGLEPGEVYVTGNAFLIKADVEKSGASHDH